MGKTQEIACAQVGKASTGKARPVKKTIEVQSTWLMSSALLARKVSPASAKEKAVILTRVSMTASMADTMSGVALRVKVNARVPTVSTITVLVRAITMFPAIFPIIHATLLEGVTNIASIVPACCSFLIPLAPDHDAFIMTA